MLTTAILTTALLISQPAPAENAAQPDETGERGAAWQWFFDHVGEHKEIRAWDGQDYGMSDEGFLQKNFRVFRVQVRSKKTRKVIDRVFVYDPVKFELYSSQDWNEIELNQPTAESWYKEMFDRIYPRDEIQVERGRRKR